MSKKALSPLIATVLLIAFAAALGTMIMNWSVGGDPVEEKDLCLDASLALQSLPQGDAICYDVPAKTLVLLVRNNGNTEVPYVRVTATDASLALVERDLEARLAIGSASKFTLQYETTSPTGIAATITPVVLVNGEKQACPTKIVQTVAVPPC